MTGVAGSHGIVIEASDVTLDLNGFTLWGAPGSMSGDGAGIDADRGCAVIDSRVSSSSAAGISVLDDCSVSGNVVRTSLDSGIRVRGTGNRVESNQVSGNGHHGIEVAGSGTTLFRNAASGNATSNYAFGVGNAFGAVVNVAGGGSFTADAWSNLEY